MRRFAWFLAFVPVGLAGIANAQENCAYHPITPCRVLETRAEYNIGNGPVGRFTYGTTKSVVWNGNPGCPVFTPLQPPSHTLCGLAVNVTAVTPSSQGRLTIWEGGGVLRPGTSTINFPKTNSSISPEPGATSFFAVTNFAIIPLGQYPAVDWDKFSVYMHSISPTGDTDITIDVVGYYE